MTHPFSLAGKVALVTGGAHGVGQAIAHALAQAGADVTVAGPAASTGAAQLDAAERALGPIDILVNNTSLLALQGGPAHAARNNALEGLTKALANEFSARSVNVNGIEPGGIATGHPDPVGNACVFLCSRAADYIHGHVQAVDGGLRAR